jgi:hypothetical protein
MALAVNRAVVPIGADLHRPECVLATHRGDLYASDSRGIVMLTRPDGSQILLTGTHRRSLSGIGQNGTALQVDGSFLLAHLSTEDGGVFTAGTGITNRRPARPDHRIAQRPLRHDPGLIRHGPAGPQRPDHPPSHANTYDPEPLMACAVADGDLAHAQPWLGRSARARSAIGIQLISRGWSIMMTLLPGRVPRRRPRGSSRGAPPECRRVVTGRTRPDPWPADRAGSRPRRRPGASGERRS